MSEKINQSEKGTTYSFKFKTSKSASSFMPSIQDAGLRRREMFSSWSSFWVATDIKPVDTCLTNNNKERFNLQNKFEPILSGTFKGLWMQKSDITVLCIWMAPNLNFYSLQ